MKLFGYDIRLAAICINAIPVLLVSVIISLCLWFFPVWSIKVFSLIGNGIIIVITILTAIAVFQMSTGIMLPAFYTMSVADSQTGLTPFEDGLLICCKLGAALSGAFPMMKWLTKTLEKPLSKLGSRFGLDNTSTSGLLMCSANYIPVLDTIHAMKPRGKLINFAFAISGMAILGDFIGFVASVEPTMITPMIVGKAVGAFTAVVLAYRLSDSLLEKINS